MLKILDSDFAVAQARQGNPRVRARALRFTGSHFTSFGTFLLLAGHLETWHHQSQSQQLYPSWYLGYCV